MKILIIGNGGREHALAWKLAQSPLAQQVFVAPGNAGTAREPKTLNVPISATDVDALLHFALEEQIDLTVVGPEPPLVLGIVDVFEKAGLAIFGPSQQAAQLEGSKTFAKDFLARHNIPTAQYRTFTQVDEALRYVRQHTFPLVIKADGLAAGKGVVIATTLKEAEATIQDMLNHNLFGQAGHRIVIEEFLCGEEASFIVMVDGLHVLPLATSQDHKRVGDGDTGPNTGGMGAYSPAPVVTEQVFETVMQDIILPTVQGMASEGVPFRGFLYAGLMISSQGEPKVIEFNCRLGDPETQPLLMRLSSDLLSLCLLAVRGELNLAHIEWSPQIALGVVMAAQGYPEQPRQGDVIQGLDAPQHPQTKVFHGGTVSEGLEVLTQGGRVLCVTALGETMQDAQQAAYQAARGIHWTGCFYRKDIGFRALSLQQSISGNRL